MGSSKVVTPRLGKKLVRAGLITSKKREVGVRLNFHPEAIKKTKFVSHVESRLKELLILLQSETYILGVSPGSGRKGKAFEDPLRSESSKE